MAKAYFDTGQLAQIVRASWGRNNKYIDGCKQYHPKCLYKVLTLTIVLHSPNDILIRSLVEPIIVTDVLHQFYTSIPDGKILALSSHSENTGRRHFQCGSNDVCYVRKTLLEKKKCCLPRFCPFPVMFWKTSFLVSLKLGTVWCRDAPLILTVCQTTKYYDDPNWKKVCKRQLQIWWKWQKHSRWEKGEIAPYDQFLPFP